MNLLVITQKVDANDAILGFFVAWLKEFSKNVEKVFVITLFKGDFELPPNVNVYSLGKEDGKGRLSRLLKFKKLAKELLPQADAVLAHMCPEYIEAIKYLNRKTKKPLYLWYTHKSVSKYLIKTEKVVKKIFTANLESCRVESDKIVVTGHGIDLNHFQPKEKPAHSHFEIISVGRITQAKNLEVIIKAVSQLQAEIKEKVRLKFIGEPLLGKDKKYQKKLEFLIASYQLQSIIKFVGPVIYEDLPKVLSQADLFINVSKTGSVDKAVLEAMALNIPVLTSNEAFKNILPKKYLCNDSQLSNKIVEFYKNRSVGNLKGIVDAQHALAKLVNKIVKKIKKSL